ncbi:uncharacterized protein LOC114944060 [Nylanderia fulva]|uniref:uncharacterized protein LOC114944060 n=1 Tax=Nylanderia fulva TaxID=613905 RepID=UPI0010FB0147|nr:uncharacterized protein LOC114944060 [Nylanderia fulva]XP_029175616.1 uncharacterized protein LOC114944060 [Nylanderia fulva]
MRLSQLKKQRDRTLSVTLPHVIKDKQEVERLFTGTFYVKLPRQSSRSCRIVFSTAEEKMKNCKLAKDKTINGKRIFVKPLHAVVLKEEIQKVKRKKVVMPEIKSEIKVTQTIFISNIANGIKSHEVRGALPGCIHVTLLKSYNKDFRSAIAKMENIQVAAEYLKNKNKWPVLKGHKIYLKSDTRTKHKRKSSNSTLKIYDGNTIEEQKFDTKAQTI